MKQAKKYSLVAAEARESDEQFSKITETGAYTGTFAQAMHIEAKTGASGIEFNFIDDAGASCRFSLYTESSDGTKIFGHNMLMAVMACMKIREISPVKMMHDIYNYDTKTQVKQNVEMYQQLIGIPIGVVLQSENYMHNGEQKTRMNAVRFFNARTRQTASEVLDSVETPKKLDSLLSKLKDKKPSLNNPGASNKIQLIEVADEDIPF